MQFFLSIILILVSVFPLYAEGEYHQVIGKALPWLSFRYAAEWQDRSGLADVGGVIGSFTKSPVQTGAFQSLERLYQNETLYNAARFETIVGYFIVI